jgi:hypothetical protein
VNRLLMVLLTQLILYSGLLNAQDALRAADVAMIARLIDREVMDAKENCRRFRFFVDVEQIIFGNTGFKRFTLIGEDSPLPVGVEAIIFAIELEGDNLELARKCTGDRLNRVFQVYGGNDGFLLIGRTSNKRTVSTTTCVYRFHPFISETSSKKIGPEDVANIRDRCKVKEYRLGDIIQYLQDQKRRIGYIGPTNAKN